MKLNKRAAAIALCGCLAIGGVAGGAFAIFSGTSDTTNNTFTVKAGKANETDATKVGTIDEGDWDPDDDAHDNMAPLQSAAKQPSFTSAAEYDCYAIMKVVVPVDEFNITGDSADSGNYHDDVYLTDIDTENWELLSAAVGDGTQSTESVYYFGYKTVMTQEGTAGTDDTTSQLFQAITVPDITYLASNLSDKSVDVSVTIIQSEGYEDVAAAYASVTNWDGAGTATEMTAYDSANAKTVTISKPSK